MTDIWCLFSVNICWSDHRGHDKAGARAVGGAEEVHGEGQVTISDLPVLPQEDHLVCGHADVHLEPGGGPRHGAGHHLDPHPGGPASAQAQCPEQVPGKKLAQQKYPNIFRCPAKLRLEEFQDDEVEQN